MTQQDVALMILHGSWQASDGWKTVASLLKTAGFPVLLVDLPGHGVHAEMDFATINLQTYVNSICQKVQEVQKKLPVILIGHSMAGMVISQVAQNMPIQQLVYIAAFLPENGECLLDLAKQSPIVGIHKNMQMNRQRKSITLDKTDLDKLFYNGCSPEVMELALSRLQPEPLLPFYGSVRLTAEKFGRTPKTYIECLQDYSISIDLQRYMHGRWQCVIRSLESGHSPHYAVPEQLSQAILDSIAVNL
jgi:pimeloyl-ACP methyl ester carboxylesterase